MRIISFAFFFLFSGCFVEVGNPSEQTKGDDNSKLNLSISGIASDGDIDHLYATVERVVFRGNENGRTYMATVEMTRSLTTRTSIPSPGVETVMTP